MFKIDDSISQNQNLWQYNKETKNIEFPFADDILAEYQNAFNEIFPGINLDESTAQGQLITALTQRDLASIAYQQNMINSFFFGGSGVFLDMWAWNLFRVSRKQGIKSTVNIEIQGSAGVKVPTTFRITDGQHYYTLLSEVTIPESGSVLAIFQAEELDEHQAAANTINQISRVVVGVDRVNNPSAASAPVQVETDSALFERCLTYGSIANSGIFSSILANVAQINGVSKIAGGENYTDTEKTIKGYKLVPHSILLCVKGASDTEIAEVIQKVRPPGCNMNGDVEVKLVYNNEEYTYKFYRPSVVDFQAEVSIDSNTIIDANYAQIIKTAICDYINGLDLATLITQTDLAKSLKNQANLFNIVDVKFGKKDGTLGYSPIQLKLAEEAQITAENITINTVAL